jgi:rhamnulokinase
MSGNAQFYVAVDLGATSGRVILAEAAEGVLRIEEAHRFPNDPVAYPGGLYWDVQRLWLEAQRGLALASAKAGGRVVSIGVDCWGVDFALLDAEGRLLENPHHYRDPRTDGAVEPVVSALGAERLYRTTGVQFFPFNTLYQLWAASRQTPGLLDLARSLVTIPDLFNYWLTGRVACEYTNATTTQFLDCRRAEWAADLLESLRIPTHFLSPVVAPGTALGPLRPELAAQFGMPGANVVAPACHDTASAVAAVETGEDAAFLSSGTWSLLGAEVTAPVVGGEAQRWNFGNEGGAGGAWLLIRNITGLWLLERCRLKWQAEGLDTGWDELLAQAAASDTAFRHLVDPDDPAFVRPDDMPAAIDEACRRSGQPAPASPGAYTRAILESLALKYRLTLERLQSAVGRRFRTLRVIGGGSQNPLLNQFTADATGLRVLAGPVEATALGNLGLQLQAAGAVASLAEARAWIARSFPPAVFEPASGGAWDDAFARFERVSS